MASEAKKLELGKSFFRNDFILYISMGFDFGSLG